MPYNSTKSIISGKVLLPNFKSSNIEQYSIANSYFYSKIESKNNNKKFSNIDKYCMFIGYPRSGHSFMGSLIDAHPNTTIAHELDVLQFIEDPLPFNKKQLFSLIMKNSHDFTKAKREWCGYSYYVPNQYHGKYKNLTVIGDKKGGISTKRIDSNPAILKDLQDTMNLPIYMIHVIRNPFDNISTITIKESRPLDDAIEYYFNSVATNAKIRNSNNVIDIRLEEFIRFPQVNLKRICKFLNIKNSKDYLIDCASITLKQPRESRYSLNWGEEQIKYVNKKITNYDFLKGYSFDN